MSTIRVKICGMTNLDDARLARDCGAHAIAFIFDPASPRCMEPAAAAAIMERVGAYVEVVGLFRDQGEEEVHSILSVAGLGLSTLQFHGDEPPAYCEGFGRPYNKAIAMGDESADPQAAAGQHPNAKAWLLDSHVPGRGGGTGKVFDHARAREVISRSETPEKWILAGGLNPGNVAQAVSDTGARAVDVCSGVEARPGKKDPDKLSRFIQNVLELKP